MSGLLLLLVVALLLATRSALPVFGPTHSHSGQTEPHPLRVEQHDYG